MPDSVIAKLERWGRRDKQTGRLTFADRNNNPFDWDDEYEYKPLIEDNAVEDPPSPPFPDIPAEMPGVDLESDVPAVTPVAPVAPSTDAQDAAARAAALHHANFGPRELAVLEIAGVDRPAIQPQPVYNIYNNYHLVPHDTDEIEEASLDDMPAYDDPVNDNEHVHEEEAPDLEAYDDSSDDESYSPEEEPSDDDPDEDLLDEEEALEDEPMRTRSGRTRVPSTRYRDDYTMLSVLDPEETLIVRDDEMGYLGVVMLQMSLKEGLKFWGGKGEMSAMKEMTQLHDMDTFIPRDPKTLTKEERTKALSTLIFLKEKANGDVKSRTCVNGAPQRAYIKKEDAASPTVMTDSVFIIGAIDAHE